jgi:hypothetical protein
VRAKSGRRFTLVIEGKVPISLAPAHESDQERLKRESALVGGVSSADDEVREHQSGGSGLLCEIETMNATDLCPKFDSDTNQVSRSLVGRLPDAVDVEIGEKVVDLTARFPGDISRGKGQR